MVVSLGAVCAGCGTGASTASTTSRPAGEQPSAEYAASKHRFIGEEESVCRPAVAQLSSLRARIGPLTGLPRAGAKRAALLIVQEVKFENDTFQRMEPPREPPRDLPLISLWLGRLRIAATDAEEFAESLYSDGSSNAETRSEYRAMLQANAYDRKLAEAYGFNYCSKLQ
ncbi:MAG TPA: hypothetical protein VH081_12460 [Solirubrobacteraceae bacterium]|nr:hypothetical protein [Solirubrobacteraceae bacterium]